MGAPVTYVNQPTAGDPVWDLLLVPERFRIRHLLL
jgi:hypothetical protein